MKGKPIPKLIWNEMKELSDIKAGWTTTVELMSRRITTLDNQVWNSIANDFGFIDSDEAHKQGVSFRINRKVKKMYAEPLNSEFLRKARNQAELDKLLDELDIKHD